MESIRKIKRWLDGFYVNNIGRSLFIYDFLAEQKSPADDPLYHEDCRIKMENFKKPVEICGLYAFISVNSLNLFGIDAPDEMLIELDHSTIVSKFGSMPRIGSLVVTHNGTRHWVVKQIRIQDNAIWGTGRVEFVVQAYVESIVTAAA